MVEYPAEGQLFIDPQQEEGVDSWVKSGKACDGDGDHLLQRGYLNHNKPPIPVHSEWNWTLKGCNGGDGGLHVLIRV